MKIDDIKNWLIYKSKTDKLFSEYFSKQHKIRSLEIIKVIQGLPLDIADYIALRQIIEEHEQINDEVEIYGRKYDKIIYCCYSAPDAKNILGDKFITLKLKANTKLCLLDSDKKTCMIINDQL